jgi:hypothetical protein
MERHSTDGKVAQLLLITTEYLIYKAISKDLNLTVSTKASSQLSLDLNPILESRPAVPPSKKKAFKSSSSSCSFSPIFSLEETLKTRSLSLLKESNIHVGCHYEIKKLRIRNKPKSSKYSLENLFNI